MLQKLLHDLGRGLVHLVQTLHVDDRHVAGQGLLAALILHLTLLHLGVELKVEGGGTGGEQRYVLVLAAVGQSEPIILASPGGGQVREPGQEQAPLVRRQPGDKVRSKVEMYTTYYKRTLCHLFENM